MPLRGESIGTAYIRVLADGSGFPDSVRDELDKADGQFDDAGSRQAKRYKKALAEELERLDSKEFGRELDDLFTDALVHNDSLDHFFNGPNWKRQVRNWEARFGGLGTTAGKEIEEKFRKQGNLQGLPREVGDIVNRINRIADQMKADSKKIAAQAEADARDFESNFRKIMNDVDRASAQSKRVSLDAERTVLRAWDKMRASLVSLSRGWITYEKELERGRAVLKRTGKDVDRNANVFGRLSRTIDHLSVGIGRAFGKGSRNDFLNFTGSFIANASKLISLPFKILDNISQFTKGFRDAFAESGKFFSSIKAGFSEMAKDSEGGATALSGAFSSVLIALPALAAALIGIVAVLGVVAALASGIVAALVALAATITFAAIGAISALAALLPPLALGFGAVALGIATMDNKTKKALKEALKPFLDSLKELGGVARSGFVDGLGFAFERLSGTLDHLKPLVHDISEALGDVVRRFINLKDKPGPQAFFDTLENTAPGIIHGLGLALANLTRALSNIFVAVTPLAQEFVDWLVRITREFRLWVFFHPDTIERFFRKASNAAQSFGDLVGAVIGLFSTLLGAGVKSGNNIFDALTRNINHFNDLLKAKNARRTVFDEALNGVKHTRKGFDDLIGGMKKVDDKFTVTGQGIKDFRDNTDKIPKDDPLADWFQHGEQTADDIGNIAVSLGKIADALDNPESRKNLHDIADALSQIGGLAGTLGFIANLSFRGLFPLLHVGPAVDAVSRAIASIGNIKLPRIDLGSIFHGGGSGGGANTLLIKPPNLDWVGNVNFKLSTIGGAAQTVAKVVGAAFGFNAAISQAHNAADAVVRFFNSIPDRMNSIPGNILGLFAGLGKAISNVIGSISLHFDFPDPPSWLDKALGPGKVLFDRVTASGGIFDGAQVRVIGEAGAEAVVPLTGPLSQVDPSVRELSRIARGMSASTGSAVQTVPGKTINVEQNITTPATDPVAAASEFLNHLTAVVA